MNCKNCDNPCENTNEEVCKDCYRDPETNECEGGCGRKLVGIAYPYVCGPCFTHSSRK